MPKLLEILQVENPKLVTECAAIKCVDSGIRELVKNMKHTLKSTETGVGLAAPQIGELVRLIVVKADDFYKAKLNRTYIAMVNPVITRRSEAVELGIEGCLSIPDVQVPVSRAATVSVDYLDLQGSKCCLKNISGLLSRVLQHEIDHLDGRLITDYAAP